jgi:hypothetical protein
VHVRVGASAATRISGRLDHLQAGVRSVGQELVVPEAGMPMTRRSPRRTRRPCGPALSAQRPDGGAAPPRCGAGWQSTGLRVALDLRQEALRGAGLLATAFSVRRDGSRVSAGCGRSGCLRRPWPDSKT